MSKRLLDELEKVFKNNGSETMLLQIGANDGLQDDPVRSFIMEHKIKAHLLEPVPQYFNELVLNYQEVDYVTCHNCGIAEKTGLKKMTVVDYNDKMPECFKGLSTFDESKNFFSGYGNNRLRASAEQMSFTKEYELLLQNKHEEEVNVFTLDDFLSQNGIDKIDVFVTDTEGYDFIIFEQLDLERFSPSLIYMETHTLGKEVWEKIGDKLKRYGYDILTDLIEHTQPDTLAVKHKKGDKNEIF